MPKNNIKTQIFDAVWFTEIIEKLDPIYLSDTSFQFLYDKQNVVIDFYQDEIGKNSIEQFSVKVKDLWIELQPQKWQIKIMFEKLKSTPYQDFQIKERCISDIYDDNGVQLSNFW